MTECRILPESVVWLYDNNRIDEAERIIRNAAKLNNIAMPGSILATRSLEITVPLTNPASAAAASNGCNGVLVQKEDNGAISSNLERQKRTTEKAVLIKRTRYTVCDIFRSFRLAVNCVAMSFLWFVSHLHMKPLCYTRDVGL